MKLLKYLNGMDRDARAAFAAKCKTSVEYLFQIARNERTPKAGLAVRIDRHSQGEVSCDELLPDVDWNYVREQKAVA